MQDFVPLGTGNSRLMKSNIPAGTTWEQAIAMLNSGTFPYDTGQLNAAGISVEGTPLNKQTLLQDTTAQQFGLTGDATVDQVLQILKNAAVVNSAGNALETVLGSTLLTIPVVQIQTGSYVGTGTYGKSNPNSLTFDFAPDVVLLTMLKVSGSYTSYNSIFGIGGVVCIDTSTLSENYIQYQGFFYSKSDNSYSYGKKSSDGKTLYWYNTRGAVNQINSTEYQVYYIGIKAN